MRKPSSPARRAPIRASGSSFWELVVTADCGGVGASLVRDSAGVTSIRIDANDAIGTDAGSFAVAFTLRKPDALDDLISVLLELRANPEGARILGSVGQRSGAVG